jgi:hypothetical protein
MGQHRTGAVDHGPAYGCGCDLPHQSGWEQSCNAGEYDEDGFSNLRSHDVSEPPKIFSALLGNFRGVLLSCLEDGEESLLQATMDK